jgi:hypothetical protein
MAKGDKKRTTSIVLARDAVKVVTAGAERAERLLDLIARRKTRIAEDFYDVGEALRELAKKKLYAALGHTSFGEMLDARKVMSRSQAAKLVAIVDAFPREEALRLGSERAYEISRLAAATPDLDSPATIMATGVTLRGRRHAAESLSVREIVAAAREARARRPRQTTRDADAEAATHTARAAQAALRKYGAKGATVRAIKRGKEWHARIDVHIDALALFTRSRT